jgi:DNA-binding MarR family transcriptional regulator
MSHSLIPGTSDLSSFDLLLTVFAVGRGLDVFLESLVKPEDLTRPDLEVLWFLRRFSPPSSATPAHLSTFFRITTGTVAVRINRLEARGFVCREPDPARRNGTLVNLTPQGIVIVDKMFASLVPFSDALLGRVFKPDELLLYRDLTAKVLTFLEQEV